MQWQTRLRTAGDKLRNGGRTGTYRNVPVRFSYLNGTGTGTGTEPEPKGTERKRNRAPYRNGEEREGSSSETKVEKMWTAVQGNVDKSCAAGCFAV